MTEKDTEQEDREKTEGRSKRQNNREGVKQKEEMNRKTSHGGQIEGQIGFI